LDHAFPVKLGDGGEPVSRPFELCKTGFAVRSALYSAKEHKKKQRRKEQRIIRIRKRREEG
jgi:hypothetical protein